MTICQRCHRPLKNPAINGMGPVCAKAAQPVQEVECDLFGFDIDAAVLAASARVEEVISFRAALALRVIRAEFRDARERLGVRP